MKQFSRHSCRVAALGLMATTLSGSAEPLRPIRLWPNGAPREAKDIAEHDITGGTNDLIAGRPIIRLTDVDSPTQSVRTEPR